MDNKSANIVAEGLLKIIIQSQPSLFTPQGGVNTSSGKDIADFCSVFIDNYAAYLIKQSKSQS